MMSGVETVIPKKRGRRTLKKIPLSKIQLDGTITNNFDSQETKSESTAKIADEHRTVTIP